SITLHYLKDSTTKFNLYAGLWIVSSLALSAPRNDCAGFIIANKTKQSIKKISEVRLRISLS
ncbi:hypothetical protein, partial [Helicobacter rodentium]